MNEVSTPSPKKVLFEVTQHNDKRVNNYYYVQWKMSNLINLWVDEPFPFLVIDNFLDQEEFHALTNELDMSERNLQTIFNSPLESKSIFKDTLSKDISKKLIKLMGSNDIKNIISQKTV